MSPWIHRGAGTPSEQSSTPKEMQTTQDVGYYANSRPEPVKIFVFLVPSSSRAVDPYLQTLLLGGKHRHWWCHTLEGHFNGFPLNGIFGDGIIFVAEMYQGEGEIALQDARRGLAMLLIFHLFLAKYLFFLNVSSLFPFGNNKI